MMTLTGRSLLCWANMLLMGILILAVCRYAGAYTLNGTYSVRLPGGAPAANVPVVIRVLQQQGISLKQDIRTITDAAGKLSVKVDLDAAPAVGGEPTVALAMIDAKDCALTLIDLTENLIPSDTPRLTALQLTPVYWISGSVVDESQKPVAGAQVCITRLQGRLAKSYAWYLNQQSIGIATPEASATSGVDGKFQFRGVTIASRFPRPKTLKAEIAATAAREESKLAGAAQLVFDWSEKPTPTTAEIVVQSTVMVSGQVINALTGKPVHSARVTLFNADIEGAGVRNMAPAMTDIDGHFHFDAVPRVSALLAIVNHRRYATGWLKITPQVQNSTAPIEQEPMIEINPLVVLSGKLLDVATKKALAVPMHLTADYQHGFDAPDWDVNQLQSEGIVNADGSFTLKVAAGLNTFVASLPGTGAGTSAIADPLTLPISPRNTGPVTLRMKRTPAYLVHFSSANPQQLAGLEVRLMLAGGEARTGTVVNAWWSWPAQFWGQTVKIRVLRQGKEVLHWTTLAANPKRWPLEIRIP